MVAKNLPMPPSLKGAFAAMMIVLYLHFCFSGISQESARFFRRFLSQAVVS
jgi:hypothetical protein